MNIFNYINKYGDYTFKKMPFNDVDNVIFACLSYIDFTNEIDGKVTAFEAYNRYMNNNSIRSIGKKFYSTKLGVKILGLIRKTKRYKDIKLYNYKYIVDDEQQFEALTIQIDKRTIYVSFGGTNETMVGWNEDFRLSYDFPVPSQKSAINYLNKYMFSFKKIIVGGHSKGGNLALVGSMYCNFLTRIKIKKIYSNDGPGLMAKIINTKNYRRIEKKYIHIIPHMAIVGLLLRHGNNYKVIKSSKIMVNAHSVSNWRVDENHFLEYELSRTSRVLDVGLTNWLDKYDYDKRKRFTDEVFDLFKKNNIYTLLDIKKNYLKVLYILKSARNLSNDTKEMLKDGIRIINSARKEIK